MNLDFALLASAADVHDGKLFLMGGGFDTFNVTNLPGTVPPFAVVLRFSIAEDERGTTHTFGIDYLPPEKELIRLASGKELRFEKHKPGHRSTTTLVLHVSFTFECEGEYGFRIYCNGEPTIVLPFFVVVDETITGETL